MFDYPTLLPPNHTRIELALEAAMRVGAPDLEPIAQLMNPDTCPLDLLPWLAWAFSVDVWEDSWAEDVKRNVIRNSIAIHKVKGTLAAVRRALESIGFTTDITEWFEVDKLAGQFGAPHTFSVDAYVHDVFEAGFSVNDGLVVMIQHILENVKPARSQFKVAIGERFDSSVQIQTGSQTQSCSKARHVFAAPTIQILAAIKVRSAANLQSTSHMTHIFSMNEVA